MTMEATSALPVYTPGSPGYREATAVFDTLAPVQPDEAVIADSAGSVAAAITRAREPGCRGHQGQGAGQHTGLPELRAQVGHQPVGHHHRPDGEGDRLEDEVLAGRRGVAEGRRPDQDGPACAK